MKPVIVGLAVLASATAAFAQAPSPGRIPQQIVINGQAANGAYVLTPSGGIQNYTCSAPQAYNTPDGATHGWACLESATGFWLLGALPPQTAVAPAPVPVAVPQYVPQYVPAPVYQAPVVVPQYIAAPQVIYVEPQPQIIYQRQPQVIYSVAPAPVIYSYPSRTAVEVATIQAAGRVAAAAVGRSRVEVIETRGGGHHRR